jgi:bifunctional UDP-N-acetylglucosamine pyrophosphorylase/glucosamine-1-phosphate N-acetyltransferase
MSGENIKNMVKEYSGNFNYDLNETAIILAAGHGKRIKSQTSKMLHKIWGKPTFERVYEACRKGLQSVNIIAVVGIKADDVMEIVGKKENLIYAYQKEQNGTGHAVKVALEKVDNEAYDGVVYVFPGDMGLINEETVEYFKKSFKESSADMMVLTGLYEGDSANNSYGRIIRVKDKDINGNDAGEDRGKVIEIIEYKDILSLPDDKPYQVEFNGRTYIYSKQELIENNEFNSGVYAFTFRNLTELIERLRDDNVQGEIYITDLISLFNKNGLTVSAVSPRQQHVIMGFNNKSVLSEMEAIARNQAYEKLKDIVQIYDPDDFFIADSIIEKIIEMDKEGKPLDIVISKGVYIGEGVELNYNIEFKKNAHVEGNVIFGQNVVVWENVHLSCYPEQKLQIGNNVEILWGDIIKGNIVIGDNSRIESSVNMTGSDEFPLRIGKSVLIKGTSYIFGSVIEDEVSIEHSVLIKKKIEKLVKKNGFVQPIRFYLPMPEGIDAIEEL